MIYHAIRDSKTMKAAELYLSLKFKNTDVYKDNGNAPVTLMSHSYGSPVTQYFLTTVTDEWKKKDPQHSTGEHEYEDQEEAPGKNIMV